MNSESSEKSPADKTSTSSARSRSEADSLKRVQLFRSGSFLLGVFESEIATTSAWREPTPLPYAPPAIRGVVSVQGRMLTVLDPSALLTTTDQMPAKQILALRGEEQLALAIDELDEVIEIRIGDLKPAEAAFSLVLGTAEHDGRLCVVLDSRQLFSTAIQGRDRRRRRF